MSLDVSAITGYIKENPNEISTEAILGLTSLAYLTIQPGVRSSININKLVTDAVLQNGGCGWSPSGTTTLTKRNLAVTDYKVQENLCDEDLQPTLYQLLGKGANDENFSLETAYVDLKVKKIQNTLDPLIWQATTVGAVNPFDGLIKLTVDNTPAGNQIVRTASIIDDVDALIAKLPSAVLVGEGLICAMSVANYLALVVEFRALDSNFIPLFDQTAMGFTYPGTNLKIVAMNGFGAVNDIMIYNQSNMFVGTDLESDLSTSKFWWSADNLEHRFHFGARIGVQIAIPEEVVIAS
jgi:hypothetical protein